MKPYLILIIFFIAGVSMQAINKNDLAKITKVSHPFNYDLGMIVVPGKHADAPVTVCCHGYGHDSRIADTVRKFDVLIDHLVGFNFPDHDMLSDGKYRAERSSFGSINEILPLIYVIKLCVIDAGLSVINLYGFSAGGGAIVNALAVLNHDTYDQQLAAIGITPQYKKTILDAVQKGLIILDCPLKSIEEVIKTRGESPEFTVLAARYKKNNMRPLDTVERLQGLRLNMLVFFQVPDDILGNSQDKLFIKRLHAVNAGRVEFVTGDDGGHNAFHATLWNAYKKIVV